MRESLRYKIRAEQFNVDRLTLSISTIYPLCFICREGCGNCWDHWHGHCKKNNGCVVCLRGHICASCNSWLGYHEVNQHSGSNFVLSYSDYELGTKVYRLVLYIRYWRRVYRARIRAGRFGKTSIFV